MMKVSESLSKRLKETPKDRGKETDGGINGKKEIDL